MGNLVPVVGVPAGNHARQSAEGMHDAQGIDMVAGCDRCGDGLGGLCKASGQHFVFHGNVVPFFHGAVSLVSRIVQQVAVFFLYIIGREEEPFAGHDPVGLSAEIIGSEGIQRICGFRYGFSSLCSGIGGCFGCGSTAAGCEGGQSQNESKKQCGESVFHIVLLNKSCCMHYTV